MANTEILPFESIAEVALRQTFEPSMYFSTFWAFHKVSSLMGNKLPYQHTDP